MHPYYFITEAESITYGNMYYNMALEVMTDKAFGNHMGYVHLIQSAETDQ